MKGYLIGLPLYLTDDEALKCENFIDQIPKVFGIGDCNENFI